MNENLNQTSSLIYGIPKNDSEDSDEGDFGAGAVPGLVVPDTDALIVNEVLNIRQFEIDQGQKRLQLFRRVQARNTETIL
ncbi:hypothetical protein G6F56_000794 [Rhizopus delemar]|nr:hypothetical protein G6F56_000794 [Rhizopus delemar]